MFLNYTRAVNYVHPSTAVDAERVGSRMFELLLGAGFWTRWKGKWRKWFVYSECRRTFLLRILSVLAHLRTFTTIFFLVKPFSAFILPSMNGRRK